jgi:hypothetical protein
VHIAGAVITADALHTQRVHVGFLAGRGAHYLLTVKGNQPTLLAQLKGLPWAEVPVADTTTGKGHGRIDRRTVKGTAIGAGIAFPATALAIKITRRRRPATGHRWHTENRLRNHRPGP